MRWAENIARIGENRNAYGILVGKYEGKKAMGKTQTRWKDNIKTNFRKVEWSGMDWIDLIQDWDPWRGLVNTAINLRVQTLVNS
jgi:hypothetical protein